MLNRKRRQQSGFTFTEIMIALALNVVLLAALTSIFSANINHYHTMLNTNRLNRELESIMTIMTSDIRRAGYYSNAANDIGLAQNNNPFMASGTDIAVTGGNCITFTYDHNGTGTLPSISSASDDDRYGFRLSGNNVQTRPFGATFSCGASASSWENMNDTKVVRITALSFTLNSSTLTTGPGTQGITQRSVDISITGELTNDASVTRTLTQHVRLRNDKFIP